MKPYKVEIDVVQASGAAGWVPVASRVWATSAAEAAQRALRARVKCGSIPIVAWRVRAVARLDLTNN